MAETLKYGNGVWATKKGSSLAYNDESDNYKPLAFTVDRNSTATRVNKDGLIEVVGRDRLRIDYTDSTKGVALLEPARTNDFPYSELSSGTATGGFSYKQTNSTVTANTTDTLSPKGDNTAAKLTTVNVNQTFDLYKNYTTESHDLTYSVFAKKGSQSKFQLQISGTGISSGTEVTFDLEQGTHSSLNGDVTSAFITYYGNGWYRCGITSSDSPTASSIVRLEPLYAGNLYVWGLQLEPNSSYATSYIPTSGSAVTRVADTANGAGNSEVFNDSEGVLYVDTEPFIDGDFESQYISLSDNTTGNNFLSIQHRNIGQLRIYAGGFAGSNIMYLQDIDMAQNLKIAVQYKVNDYKLFVNGVEYSPYGTPTQSVLTGLSTLDFHLRGSASAYWAGNVKEVKYYNTALTDAELEKLTSYTSFDEMVTELNLTRR